MQKKQIMFINNVIIKNACMSDLWMIHIPMARRVIPPAIISMFARRINQRKTIREAPQAP